MTEAEELLNSLSEDDIALYTTEPETEEHIIIDKYRRIKVPEDLQRIAVQYDNNIETVTFDCPRYWDGNDLSKMYIYVNYLRPDRYKNRCLVKNITVDEDNPNIIHFDWCIGNEVTLVNGPITFLVCAVKTNSEGNEELHWNSEINNQMYISDGLECSETVFVDHPDIINDLLTRMDTIIAADSNILDTSLTQSGLAADAKVTGDAIKEINTTLNKKAYYFNNIFDMKSSDLKVGDYAITTGYYEYNDGGSGEYRIAEDESLVDDGGSVHKLNNGLKAVLVVKNSTINVKQFGVKGDGETDETLIIQKIINNSNKHNLYFPKGEYCLTSPLSLISNLNIYGEGSFKIEGCAKTEAMFNIINKSNIHIDSINFVTTLNNDDSSEFDRDSNYKWSNRMALHISGSDNISVVNSNFNNFEYAFKIDGTTDFNKDILIDNCSIDNSPMPVYVSYTDGFIIRRCKVDAPVYASGYDHHIYGSAYCKNHIIENCEFLNGGGLPVHYSDSYNNDNEPGIYHAVNIKVSNISLVNTFGGVFIDRKDSHMYVSNIKISSDRGYNNGLFRANNGAKLTVNGIDVFAENSMLASSRDGGNAAVRIFGGYADIKNVAVGMFTDGNELVLKNVELEVKDNIIYHGSNTAKYIIDDCVIYYTDTEETSGYPLSIRNADTSIYFTNNTVIAKGSTPSYFIYNGDTDVCKNFIFANNIIKGFKTLVHSSATLVKQNNNYSVGG